MTDEPVKKQEFKEETTKAEQDKDELTEDETSGLSGGFDRSNTHTIGPNGTHATSHGHTHHVS